MKARAFRVTCLFFLLTFVTHAQMEMRPAFAGGDNGSLVVTVFDPTGAPVPDARVELLDPQVGLAVKAGYTNALGHVELAGLAYGAYEVVIVKGLDQRRERTQVQSIGCTLSVRMGDVVDPNIGNAATVSVAQYRVPGKARKELKKAQEALDEREMDKAEKHLAKALEIYPKYAEALTLRAILKMDRNELGSATADLDEALKYDSTNATTYFVYGANLNLQSKFDLAIQSLERGVALNPSGWQGYFEMAKAHVGKQDYQRALKYVDRAQALAQFEYPPLHLVKAHALLALKAYPEAMDELRAFLDKSPKDPQSADARKTLEQVQAFVAKK